MATVTNTYNPTFAASLKGYVERSVASEAFSTIRGGVGTGSGTPSGSTFLMASAVLNQYAYLQRSIILFDTSAIPVGATITAATITMSGVVTSSNGLGSPAVVLVSSNPASNSVLANSDYSNVGSTSFGSVAYSSVGNNFSIALNGSGLSNITKNGVSKFGLRSDWDQTGTFSGAWSAVAGSGSFGWTAVSLSVTYTLDFPTLSVNNISSLANVTTITTS